MSGPTELVDGGMRAFQVKTQLLTAPSRNSENQARTQAVVELTRQTVSAPSQARSEGQAHQSQAKGECPLQVRTSRWHASGKDGEHAARTQSRDKLNGSRPGCRTPIRNIRCRSSRPALGVV
jgi:hypothetical protein